jgi:hypothetical protein
VHILENNSYNEQSIAQQLHIIIRTDTRICIIRLSIKYNFLFGVEIYLTRDICSNEENSISHGISLNILTFCQIICPQGGGGDNYTVI